MAGGNRVTDPLKLAGYCDTFMQGAKKLYDEGPSDMWFFELYWHLKDCAAALRKSAP